MGSAVVQLSPSLKETLRLMDSHEAGPREISNAIVLEPPALRERVIARLEQISTAHPARPPVPVTRREVLA